MPDGPRGRVYLEHCIDNPERVPDNRIVGSADSESDQFEEARIDDHVGGIFGTTAGRLVG